MKRILRNAHMPRMEQGQLILLVKIATVAISIISFFGQDLALVLNDALRSDTTSYILAVPIIFFYVIYRKREILKAVIRMPNNPLGGTRHLPIIAGILLSTIALLLYLYGSHTFTPLEYHILAMPIFGAGLLLILFDPHVLREFAFPLAFLFLLIPPPSETLYGIGATLSVISSETSSAIIGALGIPSTLVIEYGTPTITITRPNGVIISFIVDIACSGIYSLIGFLIFAIFIAYIIRDKLWKKSVVMIIGMPIIYLFNIIRITSILLIGYYQGEEMALNVFHLLGGWTLIFLGTILLLVISERIFKIQIFKPRSKCPRCTGAQIKEQLCFSCGRIINAPTYKVRKSDFAKIGAVLTSMLLLLAIQAPVFALTETPGILIDTATGAQMSTEILPEVSGYTLRFYFRDTQFEERAKQDMSLVYLYTNTDQSAKPIWVTIEIASVRSSLHGWEYCLITMPSLLGLESKINQIDLREVSLVDNPPIIGRYFVFQYKDTNVTQAVLHWYETAKFSINSTSQQKHVEISLIMYPDNLQELPSIEKELLAMGDEIATYWQPIKKWSQITLWLSQVGDELIIVGSLLLVGTMSVFFYERRKERKRNLLIYQKLSNPLKKLVDAMRETEKKGVSTLNDIETALSDVAEDPKDHQTLLQELAKIEETGIVERVVANRDDEPLLTWRTQISF